jgi:hypothetical protein
MTIWKRLSTICVNRLLEKGLGCVGGRFPALFLCPALHVAVDVKVGHRGLPFSFLEFI